MYYQSFVLWPPCQAPPLLYPLAPPPPPLPQFLLVLPAWQMSMHSKWEERTKNKIRAAKCDQLHEMDHLKMAHTFPKDPNDRGMMHMHDFNFGRRQTFFYCQGNFSNIKRGKASRINSRRYQEVQCAEHCHKIADYVSTT